MSTFISKEGKWIPAQERVVFPDAEPGKEVYTGPDRAAVYDLKAAGVEFFGQPIAMNTELLVRAKQMGFKDTDEYLAAYGYDKEKADAAFKIKAAIVNTHKNPEPKTATRFEGGGFDVSRQGADVYGGFGKTPSVEEITSKKK